MTVLMNTQHFKYSLNENMMFSPIFFSNQAHLKNSFKIYSFFFLLIHQLQLTKIISQGISTQATINGFMKS